MPTSSDGSSVQVRCHGMCVCSRCQCERISRLRECFQFDKVLQDLCDDLLADATCTNACIKNPMSSHVVDMYRIKLECCICRFICEHITGAARNDMHVACCSLFLAQALVLHSMQLPASSEPMPSKLVFGWTVQDALARFISAPRYRDVAEIFSGVEAIVRAANDQGFQAAAFDKCRVPGQTDGPGRLSEDLCTEAGFLNALTLVATLRVGGLLWLAPVCASWIWLNLHRTQRRSANQYWGDSTYHAVRLGNHLATVTIFLMRFAFGCLTAHVIMHYRISVLRPTPTTCPKTNECPALPGASCRSQQACPPHRDNISHAVCIWMLGCSCHYAIAFRF